MTCPICGRPPRPDPQHVRFIDVAAGLCRCPPEHPDLCPGHGRDGCDECFQARTYTKPATARAWFRRVGEIWKPN